MPSKYKYFLTPLAVSDIDEALAYISGDLASPTAAVNLLSQIEETIDRSCSFPLAYPDCSYFMIQDKNIRHAPIKNYLLFYEVDENRACIRILRFRYSAMDLTKIELK